MKKGINDYFSWRAHSNLFDRHLAFILHIFGTNWKRCEEKKKKKRKEEINIHNSWTTDHFPTLVWDQLYHHLWNPLLQKKLPFKRPWPYWTRLNWYKSPFRVWSLVLSSGCLPKFPSVLLIARSAGVKKLGRSLMAHLYRSVSDCRVSWTCSTFQGVTQLRTRSSVTGVELLLIRAGCSGSVGGTTGLTGNSCCILLKASSSIVKRSESFSQFDVPSAVK